MTALAELSTYWTEHAAVFDDFGRYVRDLLTTEMRRAGIQCEVTSRVKSLDSALKKAVRKRYGNPIQQITDKVGVRVLLLYQDDRDAVVNAIRTLFDVVEYQDRRASAPFNVLAYQGVHCQIQLKPGTSNGMRSEFAELQCEIQIHTRAQNAWSESTHDLVYKQPADIPEGILRRVHILVALCELFDNEVSAARRDILVLDGLIEAQLLEHLEKHFYQFSERSFDRALSLQTISLLTPLYGSVDGNQIRVAIDSFVDVRRAVLQHVYQAYEHHDDTDAIFLHQPESILVFDRLDEMPYKLREVWDQSYPPELLEKLALAWGVSFE